MLIFVIYTRCQYMEVKVRCSKFECREEIHFKTQCARVADCKSVIQVNTLLLSSSAL